MAQQMDMRGFLKRLGLMGGAAVVTAAGADGILGAVGSATAQTSRPKVTMLERGGEYNEQVKVIDEKVVYTKADPESLDAENPPVIYDLYLYQNGQNTLLKRDINSIGKFDGKRVLIDYGRQSTYGYTLLGINGERSIKPDSRWVDFDGDNAIFLEDGTLYLYKISKNSKTELKKFPDKDSIGGILKGSKFLLGETILDIETKKEKIITPYTGGVIDFDGKRILTSNSVIDVETGKKYEAESLFNGFGGDVVLLLDGYGEPLLAKNDRPVLSLINYKTGEETFPLKEDPSFNSWEYGITAIDAHNNEIAFIARNEDTLIEGVYLLKLEDLLGNGGNENKGFDRTIRQNCFSLPLVIGLTATAIGIGAGWLYKRKVSGRKVAPARSISTAVPIAQPIRATQPLPAYLQEPAKPVAKTIPVAQPPAAPAIMVAPEEKEARRKFLMSTWDRIHKVGSRERQSQFLTAYNKLAEQHNRGNYDARFGEWMYKLSRLVNAELKIEEELTQPTGLLEPIEEEEL